MPIRKYYNQNWLPSIFNDEKNYKVEVAAPGMTKDDFNIHLGDDNELVISMEKKVENEDKDKENKKYLRREFSYTKFQQSLYLPDNVDKEKISANVSDGVLTIKPNKSLPPTVNGGLCLYKTTTSTHAYENLKPPSHIL